MLKKLVIAFLSVMTFAVLAAPNALADRQLITFTTNAPLELPGKVLPPGKYEVLAIEAFGDSGAIEITNSRGQSYGDYLTEAIRRPNPSGHTIFKIENGPDGVARVKYFIPSTHHDGFEFMYPATHTQQQNSANQGAGGAIPKS